MRKLIEYTLVSLDGVFENPQGWGAMSFRDDACMRDGLGVLMMLKNSEWNNSTILRGDVIAEITNLKDQQGGNLLAWGHGIFSQALLEHKLTDLLDLRSIRCLLGKASCSFGRAKRPN